MQKNVFFKNSKGLKLSGILQIGDKSAKLPCVIICHGYGASKDYYGHVADFLEKQGFAVFRFDFSGHGESYGTIESTGLNDLVGDLSSAINFLKEQNFTDKEKIALVGHSLGGTIAALHTSKNPRQIKSLIAVAAPFNLKEILDNLGLSYLEQMFNLAKDASNFDMKEIVKNIQVPTMLIHGECDEMVPCYHSKEWFNLANTPKNLVIIKGAGHSFSGPGELEEVLNFSTKWLKDNLH